MTADDIGTGNVVPFPVSEDTLDRKMIQALREQRTSSNAELVTIDRDELDALLRAAADRDRMLEESERECSCAERDAAPILTPAPKGLACETCRGSGRVSVGRYGSRPPRITCPDCDGTGYEG